MSVSYAPLALLLAAVLCACAAHAHGATLFQDDLSALNPSPLDVGGNSPWVFKFTDVPNANVDFKAINSGGAQMAMKPFNATTSDVLDHVKGLVMTKQVFSAPAGGKLTWTLTASAAMRKTKQHPFGSAVTNAEDDLRLGMCGLVSVDESNGVVVDFSLTESGVYALYERLPFFRTADNVYASFTQVKRVASRVPKDIHDLTITHDSASQTLSWFVGSKLVLFVDKIGYLSTDPEIVTLINTGGTEEVVSSFAPSIGFGCFTLLDAVDPWNPSNGLGLVRLAPRTSTSDYYVVPTRFVDETAQLSSRLWGAGADLILKGFRVSTE